VVRRIVRAVATVVVAVVMALVMTAVMALVMATVVGAVALMAGRVVGAVRSARDGGTAAGECDGRADCRKSSCDPLLHPDLLVGGVQTGCVRAGRRFKWTLVLGPLNVERRLTRMPVHEHKEEPRKPGSARCRTGAGGCGLRVIE
jgi:hypothetical protein